MIIFAMQMHNVRKIRHCVRLWLVVMLATTLLSCSYGSMSNEVIAASDDVVVTSDSVVMGSFTAHSPSGTSIVTNYVGGDVDSVHNVARLRLLIGGRDIELLPCHYHYINLDSARRGTARVIAFEHDSVEPRSTHRVALPARLNFTLDMSSITTKLKDSDRYVTPTRDTIHSVDFERATLEMEITTTAASTASAPLTLKIPIGSRPDENGMCTASVHIAPKQAMRPKGWHSSLKIEETHFPAYTSGQNIMNALYNMSVEVLEKSNDGDTQQALVASKCYDIALALAMVQPYTSMKTLRAMVVDSVIHCHDGPRTLTDVVNDMIWSQAAWSVYCATGDKGWLRYAYQVIVNSLNKINETSTTSDTGLYHAMSPYISHQSAQYYPPWANASDAFETMPLVGNAIIEHTYSILGQIADEEEINADYDTQASRLKDAINHRLWNESRGCYSQYLYGGVTSVMSPCVDNMGNALAILWDIADDDRTEALIKETPFTNFGVPLLYPNRAGTGTGLNNTVIPMVQAMWNLAAAKANNMGMLRRGMGALIFQQALAASCNTSCNATTGEIFQNGNAAGNAAGNIAMVMRVIAGMNFLPNGIELNPKVPVCFGGKKKITGLAYRKATLNITINGTGDEWSKITLDGKALADNFINGNLEGEHDIVITMNNEYAGSGVTTIAQKMKEIPETPKWLWDGYYGTNHSYNPNLGYRILINGVPTYSMRDSVLGTRDTSTYRNYSIVAINKYGSSYISRPHYITSSAHCYALATLYPTLVASSFPVAQSHAPIELDNDTTAIAIPIFAQEAGQYIIDVLYSNGNGPQSLNQPLELLQIFANSHNQGLVALPRLGDAQWMTTSYSSHLRLKLLKGKNIITLRRVAPWGVKAQVQPILLDHIRIIKLQTKT